jgi:beta-phosphoglucomutase-like phosphatase (HAD superfamily)
VLLNLLRGHVKNGLATMNDGSVIDKVLREQRVRQYFDVVSTFDNVKKPKPNPEIFLKCTKKFKSQPKRGLVVEDSIFGVNVAKRVKMKFIALLSGTYSKKELEKEHPDLIVESINVYKNNVVYPNIRVRVSNLKTKVAQIQPFWVE